MRNFTGKLPPIQVRDDLYANGFISKALKDKLDKLAGRLQTGALLG
jgi:hypothetical protein